jgi:hypothetical protein
MFIVMFTEAGSFVLKYARNLEQASRSVHHPTAASNADLLAAAACRSMTAA